jgi:hypothetical protein
MRTPALPSATVVLLNPSQIAHITRKAETDNERGHGLNLVDAGDLPDDDLEALGLTDEVTFSGPANRPDPVDVISIGGRNLGVDRISGGRPPIVFRGREVDLVA